MIGFLVWGLVDDGWMDDDDDVKTLSRQLS